MALDAADARFMDELFADLDASHFSIPPSQSPPKKKKELIRTPPLPQSPIPTSKHARSPLKDSSLFQSQIKAEHDLEDWFKQPLTASTPSPRRAASASGIKRQKVEHGTSRSMPASVPDKHVASVSSAAAPRVSSQARQPCLYTRARVLAVVDSSYELAVDGPGSSNRTRPEKILVLETDSHSSNVNQTSPAKNLKHSNTSADRGNEILLAALRDDWMQTLISAGCIVHLVGRFEEQTRKIPVTLDQPNDASRQSIQSAKCEPKLQVTIEPSKSKHLGNDDEDDDLWDDLASMPSLSQCATQELLASDDAPRAKIMIFASRSSPTKGSDSVDHALDNLLVVHPDVLVPATKVADVASCIRKPVVQDRLRGASDVTLSLVVGNMLHELLQACLTASSANQKPIADSAEPVKSEDANNALPPVSLWPEQWQGIGDFSRGFVEKQVEQQVRSNIESLYAIDLSADDAAIQLREKAAPFAHFARTFLLQEDDAAFHPDATLRESGRSAAAPPTRVRLRRILDVEEEIWSPVFGLKGKVDVSVECDILEEPETKPAPTQHRQAFLRGDHNGFSEEQRHRRITTSVVPLELKTGRAEVVSTEHRAQTMMYTLMMSDRYGVRVNDGLLYYSKSGELHRISRSRNEVRSLVIGRNELAHYLRHDPNRLREPDLLQPTDEPIQVLPPTIDSEHKCRRCYAVDGCMLFRRAVENVVEPSEAKLEDIEGSPVPKTGRMLSRRTPIADVFEQKTGHLTDVHLDFFRKWNRLLNLEEEDAVRIRREMWTMSAEQREKVGRCFSNMRLDVLPKASSPDASVSMRRVVHRFVRHHDPTQHADAGLLSGHITVNDPVTISIEPDMLSVAQGFVSNLTPTSVEIGLDHPLDAAMRRALAKECANMQEETFDIAAAADRIVFRIDKDELGSGMGRIRANLAALFLTPQRGGDVKRRELVVEMRPPRFLHSKQLQESFMATSDPEAARRIMEQARADPSLNEDQKVAIDKVLTAQDYALVLGMPGTGKTTTIAKLIELLVKLGKRILLTSYTHSAVDTILRKLAEDDSDDKDSSMRILRLGSKDKVHADAHRFLLPRCTTLDELRDAFESPNVVAATCLSVHHTFFSSGLAKRMRSRASADDAGDGSQTYLFDYCIVDEASQIPLPTCLGPLRFADKFVLVGDHHQLPPLVKNAQAKEGGLDISLFKLLSDRHGDEAMVALRSQYRMNDDIMRLSNEMVYGGQLRAGTEDVRNRMLLLPNMEEALQAAGGDKWMTDLLRPECKVRLLDTSKRQLDEVGESKHGELVKNHFEAELVVRIASTLVAGGCKPDQIAVVTPYRQQLKLLRSLLDRKTTSQQPTGLDQIELLTADQSQGRDKDVILVSFTRANYAPPATSDKGEDAHRAGGNTGELLNDLRRLNVTLTRAKRKLVLIGHSATLEASKVLAPLLRLCRDAGWVSEV